MLVENFGVEADLLFRCKSVKHAADGIHFAGDGFGGAAFRTFEDHVLHEMSQAVFFGDFAARAVADPHADGNRTDVSHGFGDNDETVAEHVLLDVTDFRASGHRLIVTQAAWKSAVAVSLGDFVAAHREAHRLGCRKLSWLPKGAQTGVSVLQKLFVRVELAVLAGVVEGDVAVGAFFLGVDFAGVEGLGIDVNADGALSEFRKIQNLVDGF